MAEYKLPLPVPNVDDAPFWEGCKRHELLIKKCKDCGAVRFYPDPMCPKCNSLEHEFVKASGKGKIWSYTITHHGFTPIHKEIVPYALITVRLAEGPTMISNIVDCKLEDIKCDMPVEVVFDDVTKDGKEATLPKFRPVK